MLIVLAVCIVFSDVILSWTWNPSYFRFGIPVFRARVDFQHADQDLVQRLSWKFPLGFLPALAFHALSRSEIAFRETFRRPRILYGWTYFPSMHGLIRCVPERNSTYLIGYLNLWVLGLIPLGLSVLLGPRNSDTVALLIFLSVISVLSYGVQVFRFRKVSAAVVPHRRPHRS